MEVKLMRKKYFLFLIAVFMFSMILPGYENLSRSTNWAKHPVIKVLEDGNIICIWGEGPLERTADMAYRILDRETGIWSHKDAAVYHVYSAIFPQIAEDSQGVIHMAYMDGNARANRDIWYTTFDYRKEFGEQWRTPKMIVRTREQSAWQRISIDPIREDLYVTWQHAYEYSGNATWKSNIIAVKKTKDPVTGEYSDWSEDVKVSRDIEKVSIHQDTTFANDKLHAVYEEGHEAAWTLKYSFCEGGPDFKEAHPNAVVEIPGGIPPSYWCELEADSKGNLYLLYSRRTTETKVAYKPVGQNWQDLGAIIGGSRITMIGLHMARNDVAYAIHNQGYNDENVAGETYRPVFVRLTNTNIQKPVLIRDSGRYQRTLEIDVDDEGTAHCVWAGPGMGSHDDHMDIHYDFVEQVGGPEVKLNVPDVVLTDEDVEISGEVISSANPVVNHRFFEKRTKVWGGDGPNYTMRFTTPGFYTIHYYVSDSQNLMGHDSVTVEVLDAPFQPTDTNATTEITRGYLFRAWVNKMTFKNDTRNDEKFDNLTHFNIYRRNAGETEWGSPVTSIAYNGQQTYEYVDPQAFVKKDDAQSIEYAVAMVANVGGFEKESRKTQF